MNAKAPSKLTELLFLVLIGHLSKVSYVAEIDNLLAKKVTEHVDNHAVLLGMLCLLKQFPQPITDGLIEYLAQYVRSFVAEQSRYIQLHYIRT